MRVVLAPDKFKGSLDAAHVSAALAAGLRAARVDVEIVEVPIADGGDGTVDAAVAAGFERIPVTASGPTGEPVEAGYARRGDTAVVELACVCGLARLPGGVPDPMGASSRGLGEVIRAAVDDGATQVIVGIGGSASTDGGRGLLAGLGSAELDGIELIVASDVTNPLLGPNGAAAVFAPQKGATAQEVVELERRLRAWVGELGAQHADRPGAGAAGGVGYALLTLGASLRPGIDLVLDLVGFREAVRGADLVITGEGTLDEQSLAGKAPVGVARAAGDLPVVAVAGRCALSEAQLHAVGIRACYPLAALEPDADRSIAHAADLLEQQARAIARDWL